jgi:serine/threonine-protein kinase HipA
MANEAYAPVSEMSLWWLGQATPQIIGQLVLAENNRKVGLAYADTWLQNGFALSEDLPLAKALFLPKELDSAAGAVNDARPDRWGERVIRHIFKPVRLSLLEYLYFAGQDRFGALGVSLVNHNDSSRDNSTQNHNAIATFENLPLLQQAIEHVLAGQPLNEVHTRLLRPGPSFGGAHPKSLLAMDGKQWVVKFAESSDGDTPLIEHASMTLAAQAGIEVAHTRALALPNGHAVAVERFDRQGPQRLHVVSAHTVLRAAGEPMGYPELSQLLRRYAQPSQIKQQQAQLFRRMVFNILMDNTDDHEKNHALIRSAQGHYHLSPAFDVLPTSQGLGYQQMRVGAQGHESSIDNALSEVAAFGLKLSEAQEVVHSVQKTVSTWPQHFAQVGVKAAELEMLRATLKVH